MKKIIAILLVSISILGGCSSPNPKTDLGDAPATNNGGTQAVDTSSVEKNHGSITINQTNSDVIEIKEKMFIAQINDIYLNADDYMGKTVKYEGLFDSYTWAEKKKTYNYVIRFGPGCCGTDGNAGFEIEWDGEYPKLNDWVEVIGVLETYEEDGYNYLRVRATSLSVLSVRGEEYVAQ